MTMSSEETVLELSHKILADAAEHGAKTIVVACPMCNVNLDMKQVAIEARYGTKHRHADLLPVGPGGPGPGAYTRATGPESALRAEEGVNVEDRRLRLLVRGEHRAHGRCGASGRRGRQAARRALRAYLQVHVFGPRPGDDPREDRVGETRRRGGGFLLAAHAHENLPQDGGLCGIEPLHVRDGQHSRALLVGAPRPRKGDGEGGRTHRSRGGQGEEQSPAPADQGSGHAARAGGRRRRGGHPGGA